MENCLDFGLRILTHDVGVQQVPTLLCLRHISPDRLDVSLEVFKCSAILPPLLHQISLLSDELGILLNKLILSKFPLFFRLLQF
jgi:hypothetical protein